MIRSIKNYIILILFFVEVGVFTYVICHGNHGLYTLQKISCQSSTIINAINEIEEEINQLKRQIFLWQKYPFYKEKIAREDLHMAYKNDTIYYIKNK